MSWTSGVASLALLATGISLPGCTPKRDPNAHDAAAAVVSPEGTLIPGTGVTMSLPPDVARAPVGTMMSDPKWEVNVSISTSTLPSGVATLAMQQWRARHPGEIETVTLGTLDGTLSRRPGSDGNESQWALLVQAEDRQLEIELRDRRTDPPRFEALRRHLLSVRWDPSKVDAEKAFGVTPGAIEGLALDEGSAGQLSYRTRGKPGPRVSLTLTGGSLPLVGTLDEATCRERLGGQAGMLAAPGSTVKPPQPMPKGLAGCDVDLSGEGGERLYLAFVVGPTGGFVLLSGSAPEASFAEWRPRFRAAATGLRSVR
jgi:hypothetical protein